MGVTNSGSTFDTARTVADWVREGRSVTVARARDVTGFAGRDPAPLAAWVDDEPTIGSPLAGQARQQGSGVVEVLLSDPEAEAVGLACGGRAHVMVQRATDLPLLLWAAVSQNLPVALLEPLQPDQSEFAVRAFAADDVPADYARWFGRGVSQVVEVELPEAGGRGVLTTWWPVARLAVVGAGPVADALEAQAELLGWMFGATNSLSGGLKVLPFLGRADALVVLSHDRAVDGPLLAAAVDSSVGYIGAMGSRHTQAARAEWFAAHDVTAGLDRIHGPAGLDIGGFGPAEIALSIVAEIVAVRAGKVANRA